MLGYQISKYCFPDLSMGERGFLTFGLVVQIQWYLDNWPAGYRNRKFMIHHPAAPITVGQLISGQKTAIH